jgi:hypothetical protein
LVGFAEFLSCDFAGGVSCDFWAWLFVFWVVFLVWGLILFAGCDFCGLLCCVLWWIVGVV